MGSFSDRFAPDLVQALHWRIVLGPKVLLINPVLYRPFSSPWNLFKPHNEMKLFFSLAKVKWASVLFLVIPHIEVKKTCGCYCLFRFYECSRVAHSLIVLSLSTCPVVSSIFVVGSQHTRDSNKRVWTPAYLSSSSLKFSRRDNGSNIRLIWSRLFIFIVGVVVVVVGLSFSWQA